MAVMMVAWSRAVPGARRVGVRAAALAARWTAAAVQCDEGWRVRVMVAVQ